MTEVTVRLPPKLKPVFLGRADVRGAKGGRGSGKTMSFAKMTAVQGMRFGQAGIKGQIVCGRQYMNSLADSSMEEVKRAIEDEPFLAAYYEIGQNYIRSRDGNIWYTFVGLDRNIESIKSKGRILIFWIDEGEPVTDYALNVLIPTLREEGGEWNAELWITWNPKRKSAAVEKRFPVDSPDPLIKIVEVNWSDNPKFPAKLERERLRDLEDRPEEYPHIWEGQFLTARSGAYFAKDLLKAKVEGRIGRVAIDPLMTLRAYWDIGGTGAKADACAIWIAQFVGKEIRVLDYHESIGQPLAHHIEWLRTNGYGAAQMILPHDGDTHDKVHQVTYAGSLRSAGFDVRTVPNMGAGAAMQRIEAVRRVMPSVWFNDEPTEGGRDALGWYHEKYDEKRSIGLGPNHDWSSHAADAFGLLAVDNVSQKEKSKPVRINFESSWG